MMSYAWMPLWRVRYEKGEMSQEGLIHAEIEQHVQGQVKHAKRDGWHVTVVLLRGALPGSHPGATIPTDQLPMPQPRRATGRAREYGDN